MQTLEQMIKKAEKKQRTLKQRLGRRQYVTNVVNYVMQLSSSKVEICITDHKALVQLYKFISREIEMGYIKGDLLLFLVQITIVRKDGEEVLFRIPKNNVTYKYCVLRRVVERFYKDIWG